MRYLGYAPSSCANRRGALNLVRGVLSPTTYASIVVFGFARDQGRTMKWVLIKKLIELTGYTDDAIRAKIKRGIWLANTHWRKAPDGRIHFNVEAIQQWIEGKSRPV